MSTNLVLVWIDHVQAHIIHFNADTAETDIIHTHSTHPHLHPKAGNVGAGRAPEDTQYFDDIAAKLKDSLEILIVGPGSEKLELMKYLLKHHDAIAQKVVSVETVGHPSDAQLLAYARIYFLKEIKPATI
ncbi:translational machinery protein [Undibacterium sp. TC4M20W]|uniref:translational machinery protein n=1 Tax=Undibacterium sp. TC4M20W TaxID=3413052 RepID=UPI003BEFAAB1